MSPLKRRILRAGIVISGVMIVVPILLALFGIGRASSGIAEGLRGATHVPERSHAVSFAFGSTFLVALCAPSGVLLGVLCGLSLVTEQRRTDALARAERAGSEE